jgi:hypothetical protein
MSAYEPPFRLDVAPPRLYPMPGDPMGCFFCCPVGDDCRSAKFVVGSTTSDDGRQRMELAFVRCGGCRDEADRLLAPLRDLQSRLIDAFGARNVVSVARRDGTVDDDWRVADPGVGWDNSSCCHPVYVGADGTVAVRVHRTEVDGGTSDKTVPVAAFWLLNKHKM